MGGFGWGMQLTKLASLFERPLHRGQGMQQGRIKAGNRTIFRLDQKADFRAAEDDGLCAFGTQIANNLLILSPRCGIDLTANEFVIDDTMHGLATRGGMESTRSSQIARQCDRGKTPAPW